MKTIEQASLENSKAHYCSAFSDQIHRDADIDFRKGIEFAQRWIPTDEELPRNREVVLAKVPFINYPLLFCYNQISKKWYQFDDGDFYESEVIPTHWRYIDIT